MTPTQQARAEVLRILRAEEASARTIAKRLDGTLTVAEVTQEALLLVKAGVVHVVAQNCKRHRVYRLTPTEVLA